MSVAEPRAEAKRRRKLRAAMRRWDAHGWDGISRLDRRVIVQAADEALARLTERQRAVLSLTERGAGTQRIAELLGIDQSTVRGHLEAGKRALRRELEKMAAREAA